MPYSSLRTLRIIALTLSLTSSLTGRLPTRTFSSSASMPSKSFLSPWTFLARCGSRSVMVNTGSPGLSPILIFTGFPSTTTMPLMARGMVTHWYFLIPP